MTLHELQQAHQLLTAVRNNQQAIDFIASGQPGSAITFDPEGREDATRVLLAQQRRFVAKLAELGIACSMADFGASD